MKRRNRNLLRTTIALFGIGGIATASTLYAMDFNKNNKSNDSDTAGTNYPIGGVKKAKFSIAGKELTIESSEKPKKPIVTQDSIILGNQKPSNMPSSFPSGTLATPTFLALTRTRSTKYIRDNSFLYQFQSSKHWHTIVPEDGATDIDGDPQEYYDFLLINKKGLDLPGDNAATLDPFFKIKNISIDSSTTPSKVTIDIDDLSDDLIAKGWERLSKNQIIISDDSSKITSTWISSINNAPTNVGKLKILFGETPQHFVDGIGFDSDFNFINTKTNKLIDESGNDIDDITSDSVYTKDSHNRIIRKDGKKLDFDQDAILVPDNQIWLYRPKANVSTMHEMDKFYMLDDGSFFNKGWKGPYSTAQNGFYDHIPSGRTIIHDWFPNLDPTVGSSPKPILPNHKSGDAVHGQTFEISTDPKIVIKDSSGNIVASDTIKLTIENGLFEPNVSDLNTLITGFKEVV